MKSSLQYSSSFNEDKQNLQENLSFSNLNDKEIWDQFKKGDKESFKYIYFTYHDSLHFFALKITSDKTVVKEAIQDLFANLWYSRARLGQIKSIKAYLLSSLRRSILKTIKKTRRKQIIALEFIRLQPDTTFSHEEIFIARKEELLKREIVTQALNKLSKRQKEIVYLKYFEHLGYDEISKIMGIKYQSVLNGLQKAFATLRKDPVFKKIISCWIPLVINFLLGIYVL